MSAITDLQAEIRQREALAQLERDMPPCCYCGSTTFDHVDGCAAPWITEGR